MTSSSDQQVYIVTGANCGLGKETVRKLIQNKLPK